MYKKILGIVNEKKKMTMQVKSWYFDGDCLCKDKRKKWTLSGRPFFLRREFISTHSEITLTSLFIWTNVLKIIRQNGVPLSRMRSSPPQSAPFGCTGHWTTQSPADGQWKVLSCHVWKSQKFLAAAQFPWNLRNLCLRWKYCRTRIDSVALSQTALSTWCLILWKQRLN